MADPTETGVNLGAIFKLLEQSDQQAKANNPFASTTQGINGIDLSGASTALDPFTGKLRYSPGQQIVGGLLKGLAGGLSQGFQDQYQQGQNEKASNFLLGALKGGDTTTMPEGMNPSIFNNLKNAASIFQLEKGAQAQNEQDALKKMALEKYFEKNSDAAGQFAQTGKLDAGNIAASQDARVKEIMDAYPGLSPEQAAATHGDLTKASQIATANRDMEKPLPDKISGELQNLDNARSRLGTLLPDLAKMEAAAKKNPGMTLAQLKAANLLPFSDVAALKSELKSVAFDLMNVKPVGGRPPPLSEFEAITQALDGDAPLAQGLSSKRFLNILNDRASAVQKSVKSSYGIGTTAKAAENALKDYEDTFSPLEMPDELITIRNKTTGEVKQVPRSQFGG